MSDLVLSRASAGVATLRLNRPDKRNALSSALVSALKETLARAVADPEVRVVALRGEGPDFCAGMDLGELARSMELGALEGHADARRMGDLFVRLRRCPKPVVAVVQGRALGGGCGLATACDLVLVREDAELGYTEVHLGFVPALVMAILRRKIPEGRAFELLVRGDRVGAAEAHRIGLVNQVFARATFDEDVDTYLAELASRPPSAVSLIKELLYGVEGGSFEEAIERGAVVNTLARTTEACREGVRRFLERKRS